jgi:phytoene/squalene synthetase
MFEKSLRAPIASIYGFVRLADEIVDSFYHVDQDKYLDCFWKETHEAIEQKFSLNPVLHAFQEVVHQYHIDREYIDAFLESMAMDLHQTEHDEASYKRYIYGSAEVVGLMCLKVFVKGNQQVFDSLKESACALGSAFQKVNFLRDFASDLNDRKRVYFPGVSPETLTDQAKKMIEQDIHQEFKLAFQGIKRLPLGSRLGVYLAYRYYTTLLNRLSRAEASTILQERLRLPDHVKYNILLQSYLRFRLNLL